MTIDLPDDTFRYSHWMMPLFHKQNREHWPEGQPR